MEKWEFDVAEAISIDEIRRVFLSILKNKTNDVADLICALRLKIREHEDDYIMRSVYLDLLYKAEKAKKIRG